MKRFLRELFKRMGEDVSDFYHSYGRGILYWILAVVIGYGVMHGYVALCLSFDDVTRGWGAIQVLGGILLLFSECFLAWWIWDASKEARQRIEQENEEMISTLRGEQPPTDKYRRPRKRLIV